MSHDTTLHAGTVFPAPRHLREIVTFLPFLVVGLVPPFSAFFVAALEEYAIHLKHLSPNSVMTIAIFAHVCEMFVGMSSSVELFYHFFTLYRTSSVTFSCGGSTSNGEWVLLLDLSGTARGVHPVFREGKVGELAVTVVVHGS